MEYLYHGTTDRFYQKEGLIYGFGLVVYASSNLEKALSWSIIRAKEHQAQPRLLIIRKELVTVTKISNEDYIINEGINQVAYRLHHVKFNSEQRYTPENISLIQAIINSWK